MSTSRGTWPRPSLSSRFVGGELPARLRCRRRRMKRSALAVLAVFAALAAVASASSRAPSVGVPRAAKSPAKELGPLLAVVPGGRGPVIGHADRRALWVGRYSPKLRIFNPVVAWAYARDGSGIILATQPEADRGAPKLQFVDPVFVTRRALVRLPWGYVAAIAWGEGRVNVILDDSQQVRILGVDAATHRVSLGPTWAGRLFGVKRVDGTIVVLFGPKEGIGGATLGVVDPSGALRTVAVPEIQVGNDFGDGSERPRADGALARQRCPRGRRRRRDGHGRRERRFPLRVDPRRADHDRHEHLGTKLI